MCHAQQNARLSLLKTWVQRPRGGHWQARRDEPRGRVRSKNIPRGSVGARRTGSTRTAPGFDARRTDGPLAKGDPLTGTYHSSSIATRSSIRRRQNAVQSFRRREFITLLGGAAAAWPLPARAQQPGKSHRVSFLALVPGEDGTLMQPLLERLHELGYSEGKNMTFEYRSAEGCPERLPSLALELVRANPDVLIAGFGARGAG